MGRPHLVKQLRKNQPSAAKGLQGANGLCKARCLHSSTELREKERLMDLLGPSSLLPLATVLQHK